MKKLLIYTFFLVLTITSSCNRQVAIDTIDPISKELTVSEAKSWYENEKNLRKSAENSVNYKPIWKAAFKITNKNFVIVPLIEESPNRYYLRSGNEFNEEDFRSNDSPSNLIITLDSDGNKVSYYSTLIQDNDDKKLNKKENKDNFNGYLFIKDDSEKTIDGAIIKNGKVDILFSELKKVKRSKGARDQITVCYDVYSQTCAFGGCGDWVLIDSQCTTVGSGGYSPVSVSSFQTIFDNFGGGGGGSLQSVLENGIIQDYWNKLNPTEKDYFTGHWWQIPTYVSNVRTAESDVMKLYCNDNDQDNANAFKHIVWSMLNNYSFGRSTALVMANNHEVGVETTNLSLMDQENNSLAFYQYGINRNQIENAAIRNKKIMQIAYDLVNTGAAKRLINNEIVSTNGSSTCDLSVIQGL